MSTLHPFFIPLGLILVVAAVAAGAATTRLLIARRRARMRVLEQPNSHYTSHLVLERDNRTRWHDIALDRLHEINRGEVVRLLAKVDAIGVDAIRPAERIFLDRMAELAAAPAPLSRGGYAVVPPGLQLSPRG